MQPRTITIFGSTGSIGQNAVDIIKNNPEDFEVFALTAHDNVQLLAEQALLLKAKYAVITNKDKYLKLKELLTNSDTQILCGSEGITEIAKQKADIFLVAIVGYAGLMPSWEAAKHGTILALANKESLVCAGHLLVEQVRIAGTKLIPVDSEHNAMFQCLNSDNDKIIERLVLTASGGPFLHYSKEQMVHATREAALKHPKWSMGEKITIDSATMVNKALELIEAHHIFGVDESLIDVIIHPESVIHGMVEFADKSIIAGLSNPDMRIPIAYALFWPGRKYVSVAPLDFAKLGSLNFIPVDNDKFPAINLARYVLNQNGIFPLIFNVANEIAVAKFLNKQIKFTDIIPIIQNALDSFSNIKLDNIDNIMPLIEEIYRKQNIAA